MQRTPATGPTACAAHALAYDSARGRTVLFGGSGGSQSSDTWEYAPVDPASHAAFGNGCPGSAGVPALAADTGRLPWIGETFTIRLTNIPSSATAFAFFGVSRTAWSPLALPFALDPIGMPGCTLFVSGEVDLPLSVSGNAGTVSVPIPNDSALLGGPFYNQAVVRDVAANVLGFTVSNACRAIMGAK